MRDPLQPPDRLAVAGDWHANILYAPRAIRYAVNAGADTILHAGDFAWGYDEPFLNRLDRELRVDDTVLLFVDGNHENFPKLLSYPLRPDGLRQVHDRIFHLPRGFRWTWGGVRFLALGGAHSVDRNLRRKDVTWWQEETLSAGDVIRAVQGGRADVMLTHDCPDGVPIPNLHPGLFADKEIARADKHRRLMRHVVDHVQPLQIFHGHYHEAYDETVNFGWGELHVAGLDCDGAELEDNVRVVDLDTLPRRAA